MKRIILALLMAPLMLGAGQAQADKPLPIEVFPPVYETSAQGEGNRDWQVKVDVSYINGQGDMVTEPVLSFRVQSGLCTSGEKRVVNMRGGKSAEVQQKVCAGSIGEGKTRIVGWVFANKAAPDVLMPEIQSELVYGTSLDFTVEGGFLEAKVRGYKVTATRLAK